MKKECQNPSSENEKNTDLKLIFYLIRTFQILTYQERFFYELKSISERSAPKMKQISSDYHDHFYSVPSQFCDLLKTFLSQKMFQFNFFKIVVFYFIIIVLLTSAFSVLIKSEMFYNVTFLKMLLLFEASKM